MLSTIDQTNVSGPTNLGGKLRVFSLHLDFAAGVRARWATTLMLKLAGEDWVCSSEQWKLDSLLTAQAIRALITAEATRADVLLVSFSSLNRRELELIHWLESLPAGPASASAPGLLIGLFGDESNQAKELDWTVKHCMNCAQRINRDFIWHWMEEPAAGEPEWLVSHMENFLARKLAALDHHYLPETALEFA
jgi:endonuclease/exonuclease/phosphatase family metal-dependent hydrolase